MNSEILRTDSLFVPGFAELSLTVKSGTWSRLAGGSQQAARALVDEIYGLGPQISPAVFWNGAALSSMREKERLQLPTMAAYAHPEGAFLLNLRIWENLLLPLRHHGIPFEIDTIESEILAALQSAHIPESQTARILQGRTDDLSDPEIVICTLIRAYLVRPSLIVAENIFDGIHGEGLDAICSLLTWMRTQNPDLSLLTIGDSIGSLAHLTLSAWPEPITQTWKEISWLSS